MKKTISIIVIVLILGIGIGWYVSLNKAGQNAGFRADTRAQGDAELENSDGVIEQDSFRIAQPKGWIISAAPPGVSLMVVNSNEVTDNAALNRINFKSYFAVSYEDKAGRSDEEFISYIRSAVTSMAPGFTITNEGSQTIGGKDMYVMEGRVKQQGADFAIGIGLLSGIEPNDVWVVTFNTAQEWWNEYKNDFLNILRSFEAKSI